MEEKYDLTQGAEGFIEKSDEGEDLGVTDESESESDEDASDGGVVDEEVA